MTINKKTGKMQKLSIIRLTFFSLEFVGKIFVASIVSSQIMTEWLIILLKYLPFSQLHVFTTTFHNHISSYSHQHLLLFHNLFVLQFSTIKILLYSHGISFVNVFYSFIPIIILKILKFTSVLFGTNILLDL